MDEMDDLRRSVSSFRGPSIGKLGELDAKLARRVGCMVNCILLSRGSMYKTLRSARGEGLGSRFGGGKGLLLGCCCCRPSNEGRLESAVSGRTYAGLGLLRS